MTLLHRHRCNAPSERRRKTQAGFSLIELLIVVTVIIIMTAYAVFALRGNRNAYRTDDQAMRILDFMRDANQRALLQRQPMRVEIDLNDNAIRIIDENLTGTTDDANVRQEALESTTNVRLVRTNTAANSTPTSIPTPPAPSNYAAAVFVASSHPISTGHTVTVMRFRSDGSVVDAAGTVTSSTLYIWEPSTADADTPSDTRRVRAITVFGGSGGIRLWKYNGTAFIGG